MNNFKNYIGRDFFVPDQGIEALKEFLSKNKEFMIKPIDGLGGHNVRKMKRYEIKSTKEFLNYMNENKISLVGAVHDFSCTETGKSYLFFPIRAI